MELCLWRMWSWLWVLVQTRDDLQTWTRKWKQKLDSLSHAWKRFNFVLWLTKANILRSFGTEQSTSFKHIKLAMHSDLLGIQFDTNSPRPSSLGKRHGKGCSLVGSSIGFEFVLLARGMGATDLGGEDISSLGGTNNWNAHSTWRSNGFVEIFRRRLLWRSHENQKAVRCASCLFGIGWRKSSQESTNGLGTRIPNLVSFQLAGSQLSVEQKNTTTIFPQRVHGSLSPLGMQLLCGSSTVNVW